MLDGILGEIVAWNRDDLAKRRSRVSLAELESLVDRGEPPRDFAGALRAERVAAGTGLSARESSSEAGAQLTPRLIAELKKASPSRGLLCPDFDPEQLAAAYAAGGAAALSVLTEPRFFQGDLSHLAVARRAAPLPALRKDFLFDPYQLVEARASGADAVLLIVAILGGGLLGELLSEARRLRMAALVEVHDAAEVEQALRAGAEIVGINNRDLRTFRVDLETTRRLRELVPSECLVVSESGIHSPGDVARLRRWRVDAMLVGESLVRADDVAAKVRELLGAEAG